MCYIINCRLSCIYRKCVLLAHFPTFEDFYSKSSINYIQALRQLRRLIMWSTQRCFTITGVNCFFHLLHLFLKFTFSNWTYQWSYLRTTQTTPEEGKPTNFDHSHITMITHTNKKVCSCSNEIFHGYTNIILYTDLQTKTVSWEKTTNNQCYAKFPAK